MTTNVQFGYDENDLQAFAPATPIGVNIDTRPGPMIPAFLLSPAPSVLVTYTGNGPWTLSAVQLFYNDAAGYSPRRGGG